VRTLDGELICGEAGVFVAREQTAHARLATQLKFYSATQRYSGRELAARITITAEFPTA